MSGHLLICTDLDRTLIPNGPQPESPLAREYFAALVSRAEVSLAYVSGRHRSLVEQAITDFQLPVPDFVIGDVGTTIYRVVAGRDWQQDDVWEDEIALDWAGNTHAGLADLLADLEQLQLQEAEKQNRCKLSFYVQLQADTIALSQVIEARLEGAGAQCRLIWSVDEPANIGLLDILPRRASKYHAVRALMRGRGFDLGGTVFCGDSGNDIEVLVSPVPSVLVANCSDEVRLETLSKAKAGGQLENLYVAHGGLMGMNGNYAAGMLEGIAHYHPETIAWMQLPALPELS
ncbi:MAG: haloacid dehalogenase [Zetaproteobacteria bacterium CG12_big_fil_rev_8_21_14_0_65_55_1124]|nr:MAG: haloacid dehalogenase [Zetaproteobacteria bacterium CG1_02_55_237]PIS18794.1 MAG: haloacid dehalogenase [Zetaproteobacteria bacterium CG08_land_8_20_14_0_20_55_17]PIW43910.1 MAG: haloacid dehalogenase [Zetaproteobacteria bacterium CG12_big_fil_rev_8_21_14_0_65_55_1124]PIY54475.1 MAG: haloacid dehalogenase [Zetaproteobacteria bacterium CG_4_10_14_0_8_um_filter_55_43]PIZ38229.1 MAG: haloacid dehalogenase [Zetaproteobacteria bacterium CG_4_10_14_0_2_um_filter_55_20]PJB82381.1 MAG: haloaci